LAVLGRGVERVKEVDDVPTDFQIGGLDVGAPLHKEDRSDVGYHYVRVEIGVRHTARVEQELGELPGRLRHRQRVLRRATRLASFKWLSVVATERLSVMGGYATEASARAHTSM